MEFDSGFGPSKFEMLRRKERGNKRKTKQDHALNSEKKVISN